MPRRDTPDPLATKIGARIRALRMARGITQERLAYEAGLKSKGNMSGIEKGLVLPSLPTLALVAKRLEVELLDLFAFDASDRHALIDETRDLSAGTTRKLLRDLQRAKEGRRST